MEVHVLALPCSHKRSVFDLSDIALCGLLGSECAGGDVLPESCNHFIRIGAAMHCMTIHLYGRLLLLSSVGTFLLQGNVRAAFSSSSRPVVKLLQMILRMSVGLPELSVGCIHVWSHANVALVST